MPATVFHGPLSNFTSTFCTAMLSVAVPEITRVPAMAAPLVGVCMEMPGGIASAKLVAAVLNRIS